MTLALDTNVLIELVRGARPLVREHFSRALADQDQMVASLIVLHELYLGCELHRDPDEELKRARVVLSRVQIEPLDDADVYTAASVRARLRRQGLPIGPFDSLIAGQALAKGWTVVTANTREFARIEGLNVIDWTVATD